MATKYTRPDLRETARGTHGVFEARGCPACAKQPKGNRSFLVVYLVVCSAIFVFSVLGPKMSEVPFRGQPILQGRAEVTHLFEAKPNGIGPRVRVQLKHEGKTLRSRSAEISPDLFGSLHVGDAVLITYQANRASTQILIHTLEADPDHEADPELDSPSP